ncbi:MAG: prephenate dehydratase [Candidatus Anammoxibacter sp.]
MNKSIPTVAFQGAMGAFSELATRTFFEDSSVNLLPCEKYQEMFEAVDSQTADYVVAPIENSTGGSIYDYYDLLLEYSIKSQFVIVRELKMRIRHNLIANKGVNLKDIKMVRSHPQALAQCKNYLKTHNIKAQQDYDTAGVIKDIKEKNLSDVAAIASVQAAHDHDMNILEKNTQDHEENYTRFLLITRQAETVSQETKVSVIFCVKNEPCSLYKTFNVFASRNLDIVRVETRPLMGTTTSWRKFARKDEKGLWDFLFYIDVRGNRKVCEEAIEHLRTIVLKLNGDTAVSVLGYYPEGNLYDITGKKWR